MNLRNVTFLHRPVQWPFSIDVFRINISAKFNEKSGSIDFACFGIELKL